VIEDRELCVSYGVKMYYVLLHVIEVSVSNVSPRCNALFHVPAVGEVYFNEEFSGCEVKCPDLAGCVWLGTERGRSIACQQPEPRVL
jgi:hypothetical protein